MLGVPSFVAPAQTHAFSRKPLGITLNSRFSCSLFELFLSSNLETRVETPIRRYKPFLLVSRKNLRRTIVLTSLPFRTMKQRPRGFKLNVSPTTINGQKQPSYLIDPFGTRSNFYILNPIQKLTSSSERVNDKSMGCTDESFVMLLSYARSTEHPLGGRCEPLNGVNNN